MATIRFEKNRHQEIRPDNWPDLYELLFDDTFDAGIGRYRSTYAYRGMSDSSWSIVTSLQRLGRRYPKMEKNIIKQFEKYGSEEAALDSNQWRSISLGQHYGLPTRILDWSFSPQVALHFATENTEKISIDGVVWKVSFADTHSLLSDGHKKLLDKTGSSVFTFDALSKAFPKGIKSFEKETITSSLGTSPRAIFFEPPSIDGRIINQFAYFSSLSPKDAIMSDWLLEENISKVVRSQKIIIPSEIKWEARDKLDQSNINERMLFPGLSGLCTWLRRHYMPI